MAIGIGKGVNLDELRTISLLNFFLIPTLDDLSKTFRYIVTVNNQSKPTIENFRIADVSVQVDVCMGKSDRVKTLKLEIFDQAKDNGWKLAGEQQVPGIQNISLRLIEETLIILNGRLPCTI